MMAEGKTCMKEEGRKKESRRREKLRREKSSKRNRTTKLTFLWVYTYSCFLLLTNQLVLITSWAEEKVPGPSFCIVYRS